MGKKIRCSRMWSQITQDKEEYETQLKSHVWHKLPNSPNDKTTVSDRGFSEISRTMHARLVRLEDGRQWLIVGSTAVCLHCPTEITCL